MIRINLLESITDKPTSTVVVVEKKISSQASRFYLLSAVVAGLLVLGIGYDYYSATSAKAAADAELENQQRIAKQMEAVMKEQAELDQKIKAVDDRIKAIKDLRASQAGPSAVLEALRERIANAPGLFLESVEQKGDQLTIKGNSPDEYVVTSFGRSLEFSSGLFTNLNIETQRKEVQPTQVSGTNGMPAPAVKKQPETVNFTIRCAYTPSKASLPNTQTAGVQPSVAPAGTAQQTPQIAKNNQ